MEQVNNPPSTPKDATKATEEQQELQRKLECQNDDPDAPGRHQNRDKVADERSYDREAVTRSMQRPHLEPVRIELV
jgi:hypothetical protein